MSAREAWPQCLPVLLLDSNGLGAFLSREMHKWKFLTPQKEAGPLWSHTREACQSPEEADTLSAAGQRARGAESAGASLYFGNQADTHMCTHIYSITALTHRAHMRTHALTLEYYKGWNGMFQLSQIPKGDVSNIS